MNFPDWKTARRYAGPLPHTFTPWDDDSMLIVRGIRQHWQPRPVAVCDYSFSWLDQAPFQHAVLASAFEVTDIPYHWEKGIIDKWH